eukprot:1175860-Prorocentrum_minimum.AAC.4
MCVWGPSAPGCRGPPRALGSPPRPTAPANPPPRSPRRLARRCAACACGRTPPPPSPCASQGPRVASAWPCRRPRPCRSE